MRKIPTRIRGTNFCTSSARFTPSFVMQPNGPDCSQIVRNEPNRLFRVHWHGSGAFVAKNSDANSWHELLHLFGPFCIEFRKATKQYRMHPNSMKCTKTSVFGPMGWIGCVRCEKFRRDFEARTFALVRPVLHRVRAKIPMRLRGTNFCTSSARFAPSSCENSDATSWHKLLH